MLDTFKARLKAKTKAAGVNLSQKRIDAYADRLHKKNPDTTEEADHDKLIDDLDEMIVFSDIAKEDDKLRTAESKLKDVKPAPAKKEDPPDEDEDDEEEEEPDQETTKTTTTKKRKGAKTTRALLQEVMQELQAFKGEKKMDSIKGRLKATLKEVPEKFYSNWTLPDKDEDVEAFEEKVKTQWEDFSKDLPAPTGGGHRPTRASGATGKVDEKELDAILDKI